jgi:hypothetical protein
MDNSNAWIQTYTGKAFWPLEPLAENVNIIDIAHALSNICRFTGHTSEFYSVAEHCYYASLYCDPKDALWGLLHDASEAYLMDMARPLKYSTAGVEYRIYEERLQNVICDRFGLPHKRPYSVSLVDRQLLRTEQRDLFGPAPVEWEDNRTGDIPTLTITGLKPRRARRLFLRRFKELGGEIPLYYEVG